ncbi:MAG: DNA-processing protein DprA [Phycisphaerales bacterium]|nr:DNA-processing protein DprA [Phycisphaerales bacterium]
MDAPSQARLDWLRLTAAEGIGPATVRRLLSHYGEVAAVLAAADSGALVDMADSLPVASREALAVAIRLSQPDDELERLARYGGDLVAFDDVRYPPPLMNIPDPPPVLRVAGNAGVFQESMVAVVGTRRCSPVGIRQAGRFAGGLASVGVCVVSGGARGIDAESHRAALRAGGRTVAVLGSGLGCPYPSEHSALFDEIRSCDGAVVSELPTDRGPRPSQFPRRNRIISGLSSGVLVIEAPRRSGAMLTAKMAVEAHGRDCWVVPGDADRREARGGLEAIRDGWAACVMDPADVLADLGPRRGSRAVPGRGSGAFPGVVPGVVPGAVKLSEGDARVAAALRKSGGGDVAAVIELTGMPPAAAMRSMTSLELMGVVSRRGQYLTLTPAGMVLSAKGGSGTAAGTAPD